MSRGHSLGLLVLFILLSLIRGTLYAALVPPWQGPDEPKHFEYVRLLHEKHRPIGWGDANADLEGEIIASMERYRFWELGWYEDPTGKRFSQVFGIVSHKLEQPLLGYLPYALILEVIPLRDTAMQLYAMRLLSVLLGILITVVAWFTVVELFPGNWCYIIGIMTFIVFLPMHSFMLGMVNSDHFAELFTYLVFFVLVRMLRRGITLWRLFEVAVFASLGALAKRTALLAVPAIGVAALLYPWRQEVRFRLKWPQVLAVLAGLGMAGALVFVLGRYNWPIVNQVLAKLYSVLEHTYRYYLFLPSEQFPFTFDRRFFEPEALPVYQRYFVWLYCSFWGWFGWLKAPLSPWLYTLLGLVSITAILGLLALIVRAWQGRLDFTLWQKKTLILFAASIIFTLLIVIAREIRNWDFKWGGYPQGRFLFPILIPIATLFFVGLFALVPERFQRWFTLGYVVSFVVFDAYALLRYVLPFFYG